MLNLPPQAFWSIQKSITISSNSQDYNLFTALGSPAQRILAYVLIDTGILITSSAVNIPAFLIDTNFQAGSRIFLVNKGSIIGKGGQGGTHEGFTNCGSCNAPSVVGATVGGDAGDALDLLASDIKLFLDNTNGNIYGGGGGGGGGGSYKVTSCDVNNLCDGYGAARFGGSGGGGAGSGAAGTLGSASGTCGSAGTPSVGTAGTNSTNGTGGGGQSGSGGASGSAGDGGTFGAGGNVGSPGSYAQPNCIDTPNGNYSGSGANGGAAGKAIELNVGVGSTTLIWRGGNTAAKVKGDVS